ncbi:MAG TPA: hypothetical protein VFP87_12525 [Chitinophagaceae bacterium]|nr:hypothetical protein [Chitinophagaceae bacterium]
MKQISFFCVALMIITTWSQPFIRPGKKILEQSINAAANAKGLDLPDTIDITSLFTLSDAEKILGEPAHLADSASTVPGVASETSVNDSVFPIKKMALSYKCAYEANAEDKKTGRTGKVYFLFEQYPQISSAATVYSYYKRSNQNHPGFKERHDLGDEAWSGNSPVSVYVRKGNILFGVKVNKMTSHTSSGGFNQVVKKIAATF